MTTLTVESRWDTVDVDGYPMPVWVAVPQSDGPFGAVCFLLQNLADRGVGLRSDWWISSGAITGVHEIRPGQQIGASFGEIGSVAISTTTFGE